MEIIQKRMLYKELSKPEYNSGSGFYTEDLGEEMSLVHESIFGWWTPDFLYVLAKWNMGKSTAINIDVLADRMLNAYMNEEEHISPHDIEIILWSLGKLGLTDTIIRILPEIQQKTSIVERYN